MSVSKTSKCVEEIKKHILVQVKLKTRIFPIDEEKYLITIYVCHALNATHEYIKHNFLHNIGVQCPRFEKQTQM